jgi:hypothetical protein
MTDDEALSKDDTLQALRKDALKLKTTVLTVAGKRGPVLVEMNDVLQLLTKYFHGGYPPVQP